MSTQKGLGKGLSALFGDENEESAVKGLKIKDIEPNPHQPRQVFHDASLAELAESIRKNGVITPITVRKTGDTYQIIAGERRWRACRMAGLQEIPAVVLDIDDKTAYELALIENLQREDLNPIEEAEGYKTLMDEFSMTQDQVAERVGRSRPAVANAMRLLALPKQVSQWVSEGELSAGHARTLLGLSDPEALEQAAVLVIDGDLSVRDTEKLVKRLNQSREGEESPKNGDMNMIYIEELQRRLSASMGHKITINHGKKKGKIVIEYYGNEDLEALTQALSAMPKA